VVLANFNLVNHERAIGFKPAMGTANDLSLLQCLDGVMVPLSITFEVPVGLKVERDGFQEELPGGVGDRGLLDTILRNMAGSGWNNMSIPLQWLRILPSQSTATPPQRRFQHR
jgi:hypothetical protein